MISGRESDVIPLRQATRTWFSISLQTFGGPAGQIAVMQRTLVDEQRWLGQQRFLHALNFCMLLPGPEAQQLAIYTGWLLNGLRGGLIAGTLFVLPGLVAMFVLAALYVGYGDTDVVTAIFAGVGPAVLAIVIQAVWRVGTRALRHVFLVGIAVAAFVSLTLFGVPFPVVIAVAGLLGWLWGRWRPDSLDVAAEPSDGPAPLIADDALHQGASSWRRNVLIVGLGLVIWLSPVALAALLLGRDHVVVDQGIFFSGTALVTFGGAYAVLSFVAYQAVEVYHWLAPGEMVRGLALAETTPGPLIMVVQFVAFLGAYRNPGELEPWTAAVLGGLLVTWATFVPCFVFIFLGAPYVERLRGNASLSAALTGVTAAVVGVIANLAVFFALHTLFEEVQTWHGISVPVLDTVRWSAIAIGAVAALLLFRLRLSVLKTLGICALLGLLTLTG